MSEPGSRDAVPPREALVARGPCSALTLANGVTLARLGAAPFLAAGVLDGFHASCGLLFLCAVATDFADGRLARRRGEATRLGGFLDHATDAIFVTSGLAALASLRRLTPLLPVLVMVSFLQYTIDSNAHRGHALRASALGRANGIAYYALLGTALLRDALAFATPSDAAIRSLAWALVASTVISIADRARASS
jgi:phosphatidylglycerophosphate synthase